MTVVAVDGREALVGIPPELGDDLMARAGEAGERARRRRRGVVASASIAISPDIDVGATVLASRRGFSRSFSWEQPDRSIGGLGSVIDLTPSVGRPDRFAVVAERAALALQDAAFAEPSGRGAAGAPIFVGGFSFSPEGCRAPEWRWLPPGLMSLPAVAFRKEAGSTVLTVNVLVHPGDDPVAKARLRMADLDLVRARHPTQDAAAGHLPRGAAGDGALGALWGASTASLRERGDAAGGSLELRDGEATASFERGVDAARRIIASGPLEKVVLGRAVTFSSDVEVDPEEVYGRLRRTFSDCYCFAVAVADRCFLGASPELLLRRAGSTVSTVAMAGSAPRGRSREEDDRMARRLLTSEKDLAEHALVVHGIERALDRVSLWLTAAPRPGVARISNIQHLATPIRAQLKEPLPAVRLAGLLHPTPAVGGEPADLAAGAISRLEGFDRGWYAGPIGWMDSSEDGEFCVGLRSALLCGRTATCYAGAGVVSDSTPEGELAETQVKLQAMLGALSG